jgi:hypothetical protein
MTVSFDDLQAQLLRRLTGTTPEAGAAAIVVCPSITFPVTELRKITGIQFYEERLLFLALLLRDPALHILFPTSVPIDEAVVEYYLSWLPDPTAARPRLHLFPVGDPEPRPLVDKLLRRPDVIEAMRRRLPDPQASFILPFNVTPAEARLAEALGIPIYGTHPDLVHLGSKSGAREVAAEAGVAVFAGAGDLASLAQMERAIAEIRTASPEAAAVVAKLNNGFSGQGNVILELDAVRGPLASSPAVFCAAEESWATYEPKVEAEGAIVEELARGAGIVSPSVQIRILPGERVEVVSTHDQILGGPDEQVYLGCRFPARDDYRETIQREGLKVARVLARRGALGSFGIDFVVVPGRGVFLSEINLRLGGTTHPFLMARYVTGGTYDEQRGELLVDGTPRVYKASDNIKSVRYQGLQPAKAIAALEAAGLRYNGKSGAVLHLLGALPEHGKCGAVCIAATHDEADALYETVLAALDAASRNWVPIRTSDCRP